jgi:hypothetical protein
MDINDVLGQGEIISLRQSSVLDQGFGNQADGTLYLTNQNLIFNVAHSTLMRGLKLKVDGEKDADVEFIHIPLELVRGVEKKRLNIRIQTEGSLFQERIDKKSIFGKKGDGRIFQNGPETFSFAFNLFVDKDQWVNDIRSLRDSVIASTKDQKTTMKTDPDNIKEEPPAAGVREKIIIREVIKIKCPYCGTVYEQKNDRCPFCGGRQ